MKTVVLYLTNYLIIFTNLGRTRSGDTHLTQIWYNLLVGMFSRYKIKFETITEQSRVYVNYQDINVFL